MGGKFYITTPIYYVNDRPHIGHAYTTIAADVIARYHHLLGKEVIFLTGTDENAQKVADAAEKSGEDVRKYLERMAEMWETTWKKLNISYTDFIRTTENRHRKTVLEIWRRISENGDIYLGEYEGLYCRGHEAFLKEGELVEGLCPDHRIKPEKLKEKNYFFRLKKYEKDLKELYEKTPQFVVPSTRFNEVKKFVLEGLEDISISRAGQKWGIPVPDDSQQVIYVWFDALINYISAVGIEDWEKHPADLHTIGKDIIRFHAVIWPAMLMSAGLPLPRQILVNGFFTIDGVKISKSLGNAIDPLALSEKYGVDALRYFLLREIPYGEDGDFSEAKLKERYNADLANGLGNLVSRIMKMSALANVKYQYLHYTIKDWFDKDVLTKRFFYYFDKFDIQNAMGLLWSMVANADSFIQRAETFKKIKSAPSEAEKELGGSIEPWYEDDKTAAYLLGRLHRISLLIAPLMPETSEKILEAIKKNSEIKTPLFPRKEKY